MGVDDTIGQRKRFSNSNQERISEEDVVIYEIFAWLNLRLVKITQHIL